MHSPLAHRRAFDLVDLQRVLQADELVRLSLELLAAFVGLEEVQLAVEEGSVLDVARHRAVGFPEDHRVAAEQLRSERFGVVSEFEQFCSRGEVLHHVLVVPRKSG